MKKLEVQEGISAYLRSGELCKTFAQPIRRDCVGFFWAFATFGTSALLKVLILSQPQVLLVGLDWE